MTSFGLGDAVTTTLLSTWSVGWLKTYAPLSFRFEAGSVSSLLLDIDSLLLAADFNGLVSPTMYTFGNKVVLDVAVVIVVAVVVVDVAFVVVALVVGVATVAVKPLINFGPMLEEDLFTLVSLEEVGIESAVAAFVMVNFRLESEAKFDSFESNDGNASSSSSSTTAKTLRGDEFEASDVTWP